VPTDSPYKLADRARHIAYVAGVREIGPSFNLDHEGPFCRFEDDLIRIEAHQEAMSLRVFWVPTKNPVVEVNASGSMYRQHGEWLYARDHLDKVFETVGIRKNSIVRVCKGALIHSIHPQRREDYRSRRANTVRVNSVFDAYISDRNGFVVPKVVWAGSGGYWCEASILDVKLI